MNSYVSCPGEGKRSAKNTKTYRVVLNLSETSSEENRAPVVNAGTDLLVAVGESVALDGQASDDGLPRASTLATRWRKESGLGNVVFFDEATAKTTAIFSVAGDYELSLEADDGALQSADRIHVSVTSQPERQITVVAPNGGESLDPGSVQVIRWTAVESTDVVISYSSDGGETYPNIIAHSVDDTMPEWAQYPWTVPDTVTARVLLRIEDYRDSSIYDDSDGFFSIGHDEPSDAQATDGPSVDTQDAEPGSPTTASSSDSSISGSSGRADGLSLSGGCSQARAPSSTPPPWALVLLLPLLFLRRRRV